MTTDATPHDETIREQFTRQAEPFARLPGHLDAIAHLIDLCEAGADDTVLDVGCGPGLLACAFAKVTAHVTGIDMTSRMITLARQQQREAGLHNMTWCEGVARDLPYDNASFSIVVSRYMFHHVVDPAAVLREMYRVCRPGGRVLVADPVLPAAHVDAFNAMERMRDPSHTAALSTEAFDALFRRADLTRVRRSGYDIDMALEAQLAASFPAPGDDERLRQLFQDDLTTQRLGVKTRLVEEQIYFTYPIAMIVGTKG